VIVRSATDAPSGDDVALARLRRRGAVAAMAALLVTTYVVGAVAGYFPFQLLPPSVLSLVLLPLLAVAFLAALSESRMPGAAASARPVISTALAGLALLSVVPMGFASAFLELGVNQRAGCALIPPPGDLDRRDLEFLDRCEAMTSGEKVGLAVCAVLVLVTVLLLVVATVLGGRSRTVSWLVFPLAGAGCVIAFDLGHVAAVLVKTVGS
jgi:hypothetical protein